MAEGGSINLKCPSPVPFLDCQFKGPDGKVHKIGTSGKVYKSGNVESLREVRFGKGRNKDVIITGHRPWYLLNFLGTFVGWNGLTMKISCNS